MFALRFAGSGRWTYLSIRTVSFFLLLFFFFFVHRRLIILYLF